MKLSRDGVGFKKILLTVHFKNYLFFMLFTCRTMSLDQFWYDSTWTEKAVYSVNSSLDRLFLSCCNEVLLACQTSQSNQIPRKYIGSWNFISPGSVCVCNMDMSVFQLNSHFQTEYDHSCTPHDKLLLLLCSSTVL